MGPIRTNLFIEPPNPNPQTPKPQTPKAGHKQVCKAFEGARWWCVIVLNIFEHTCKIY